MPHTNRFLSLVFAAITLLPSISFADYGIVPQYQILYLSAGAEYLTSSENYDSQGLLNDITIGGRAGYMTQYSFWSEGEYGFAQDWSARARLGFLSARIVDRSTTNELVAGSALSDITLGLKWSILQGQPGLTLEVYSKVPAYSIAAPGSSDLVPGDGSFDIAAQLHGVSRIGDFFFFLSPGFVLRSSGYAAAVLVDGAIEGKFDAFSARLFAKAYLSTTENVRDDSSLNIHDTPGSGNTYLRLSGSPTLYTFGGKFGVKFDSSYSAALTIAHSLYGARAGNFFQIGLSGMIRFDFFVPEKKKRVFEVPLEGDTSEAL